jgi:hypothetical protein
MNIELRKVGLDEEEADECGARIGEIYNPFEHPLPYCRCNVLDYASSFKHVAPLGGKI